MQTETEKAAEAAKRKFLRAAEELGKALEAARMIWPEANIYLAGSTFNLMSGPHHDGGARALARPDLVIVAKIVRGVDCGDW
jgi:hypothetical protein